MSPGSQNVDANDGAPKKRRWLWPLLIVSLALNLLFVGLMAGNWWRHGGHGGRNKVFTGAIEKLMQDLPEAKRDHAATLLNRHREEVRPLRQQLRDARKTAKDAVLTEPYDAAKVEAALARFREIRTSQHKSMHNMIMDLLKDLNLEERKKLLDHIRAGFKSRWRRRGSKEKKASAPER